MRFSVLARCLGPSLAVLASCSSPGPVGGGSTTRTDTELFDLVQRRTFDYFWDGAEPTSGLARERIHLDGDYPWHPAHIVTSGGSGMGLMSLLVGIERGFVTRAAAVERLQRALAWLETADRFHGAFPHWWDGRTGRVVAFSEKDDGGDLLETSLLVQGLLCVRQYFQDGSVLERELAAQADGLWRAVEWDWYRGPRVGDALYWHWSPRFGWAMGQRIEGWNEGLIAHVLAAASPTHGVPKEVYHRGWARDGAIVNADAAEHFGLTLGLRHAGDPQHGGPLFWAHYSFLGLDPRGLVDRYADYWQHNVAHVLVNQRYCASNPGGFPGYGEDCWGLTASYSPTGYVGHEPARDLGVIAPTAALASFPYTPHLSMAALRRFHDGLGERLLGPYGFYDAFSLQDQWFPRRYLAIDQGPIVVMMENHRSGMIWNLFMSCPEISSALSGLGFRSTQVFIPKR